MTQMNDDWFMEDWYREDDIKTNLDTLELVENDEISPEEAGIIISSS